MKATITDLEEIIKTPWDFGNQILYELCANNLYHENIEQIIAKVWLIGRAYSAAIERRKNKTEINDDFYIKVVAPEIKKSEIDKYFRKLNSIQNLSEQDIPYILESHKYLTDLFSKFTGLEKRSLSSKYLHFHFPNLFFIYDSRVVCELRQFIKKVPKSMEHLMQNSDVDKEYAKFVCKSFVIRNQLNSKYNLNLNMRQFDNVLIYYANSKLKKDN